MNISMNEAKETGCLIYNFQFTKGVRNLNGRFAV